MLLLDLSNVPQTPTLPQTQQGEERREKENLLLNPLVLFILSFDVENVDYLFFTGTIFGSNKHSPQSNLTAYTC